MGSGNSSSSKSKHSDAHRRLEPSCAAVQQPHITPEDQGQVHHPRLRRPQLSLLHVASGDSDCSLTSLVGSSGGGSGVRPPHRAISNEVQLSIAQWGRLVQVRGLSLDVWRPCFVVFVSVCAQRLVWQTAAQGHC
jgi:hypothetical protein